MRGSCRGSPWFSHLCARARPGRQPESAGAASVANGGGRQDQQRDRAHSLSLSPKSVETYRARLMKKLGVENIPALVKFAVEHGLTPHK
ncbi:MAG: LuxR C-terminal-related transcriptional regulator [Burkholderiales bacterium]|nr:LuxR C-terminal-related transcriptional regulator [Burkholderiales bacterium]